MKKNHYDYVDIGTSYFETSADILQPGERALLIEPISEYLDRIPDKPGVDKYAVAVSDYSGDGVIYYVDEEILKKYGGNDWILGCNSLNVPHPTINAVITQNNLDAGLMKERKIQVVRFSDVVKKYNIGSIGHLKIDTEAHDHIILKEVLDMVSSRKISIGSITVEYIYYFGNTEMLDLLFRGSGYKTATLVNNNVTLTNYEKKNDRSGSASSGKKRGRPALPRARKRSR